MPTDAARRHAFFFVGTLILFFQAYRVPITPMLPGLDGSYPHVLNLAAFTLAKFGQDIIYTYGPLGFLLAIEDVGINLPFGFLFWTLTYAVLAAATSYFIFSRTKGWSLAGSFVFGAVVAGFIDPDRLLICLTMLLLFIGYEEPRYRTTLISCCASLAAVGLLMKVTIGVGCVGAIFSSLLVPFTPTRAILKRAAVATSAIVITFYFVWVISCGSFEGAGSYFYNSFQLSAGYTATMSVARSNEALSLILFLCAMTSLAVFAALLPRWRNLHCLFVVLPTVAIAWKHGVVRYDGHVLSLFTVLAFSTFCVSLLHRRQWASDKELRTRSAVDARRPAISVIGAIAVLAFTELALISGNLVSIQYTAGLLHGMTPMANLLHYSRYRAQLKLLSDIHLAGHRLGPELLDRIGNKTVDVYSYELGFIAANPNVNWRLQPIFQHFNAFTDHLDRLNADFFAAPNKPDFLLTHHPNNGEIAGVDGRHQLFDDPIAFLQIMRSYRTAFVERDPSRPQVGLLERTENQRFGQSMTFKTVNVSWNKTIPLPVKNESSILRARVELQKPMSSQVKEALFRLSPIYLVYVLTDGTEQKYRLMPTHLKSGVWIDPLFENYWELYRFLGGEDWAGPKVVAIRFESDNPTDYSEPFSVSWEKIDCNEAAPCKVKHPRLFAASTDGQKRSPVLIGPPTATKVALPTDTIYAIDVRLSTYAKTNKGALTVEAIDDQGNVLGKSTLDASLVGDNAYTTFVFDQTVHFPNNKAEFRLSYVPEAGGTIAAWRTSETAAAFDLRVYADDDKCNQMLDTPCIRPVL